MSKDLDQKIQEMGFGKLKLPLGQRVLIKLCPKMFMRKMAKSMGVKDILFDKAHELFSRVERIDLFPRGGADGRALTMILDNKTALFFYQEGDHFKYDGYEMGEYEKGEITVFDDIKNPKRPYA